MIRFGSLKWSLDLHPLGRSGNWLSHGIRWVGLLLCSATLLSQAWAVGTPLSRDYIIRRWDMDNGLPHITVKSLEETKSGELLIGTLAGVAQLQGDVTAHLLKIQIRPGVKLGYSLAIKESSSGELWIGSYDAILSRSRDGVWRTYTNSGLGYVETIAENHAGQIFFGSSSGLFHFEANDIKPVETPKAARLHQGAWRVTADREGQIWIRDDVLVARREEDQWRVVSTPSDTNTFYSGFLPSKRGGIWISDHQGVQRIHNGLTVEKHVYPEGFDDPVVFLLEDSRGSLWAGGFYNGLSIYHADGTFQRVQERQGLVHTHITCLHEDREGNIYVGSGGGGVIQLTPRRFTVYHTEGSDSSDDAVRSITSGVDGMITYCSETGNLYTLRPGETTMEEELPMPVHASVVLRQRDNTLWIGTEGDGVYRLKHGRLDKVVLAPHGFHQVRAIFEDSKGGVWMGTEEGYAHIRPDGGLKTFTTADDPELADVRSFAETSKGEVFFSSVDFLFTERDGIPQRVNIPTTTPGVPLITLAADGDGGLWVSMRGGGMVWRSSEGVSKLIEPGRGIPNFTLSSFITDNQGHLWAGSFFGIFRFRLDELQTRAHFPGIELTVESFNHRDGLSTDDSRSQTKPSVTKTSDGRLWFATGKGVASVDPSQFKIHSTPPPIEVQSVVAGGSSYRAEHDQVTLPAGTRRVLLRFSMASLSVPERLKFQFQLENSDHWTDMGPGRLVDLDGLSPGRHRLRVRASNSDGYWKERDSALVLNIETFFWETLGFKVGGTLLVVFAVPFLAIRTMRERMRVQNETLAKEQTLSEERARSSAVIEATSDLVLFADHEQKIFFINNAGRRLLKIAPEADLSELDVQSLFASAQQTAWSREILPMALRSGLWGTQTLLRSKTGEEIPVTVVVVAHRELDETRTVRFVSLVCRDLREQRQIENAKRTAEDRLRLVAENIPACLAYLDSELRPQWLNRSFSSLLGLENSGSLPPQRALIELLPGTPSAEAASAFEQARTGLEVRFDWNRNGIPSQLFDIHCIPHQDSHGTVLGVFVVCLDITQRKEEELKRSSLEIQLAQAQKMESLGTLAGGIAHDFNNILASISGNTQLAISDVSQEHPAYDSLLEVQKSSRRASGLVRQILTFSRQQEQPVERVLLRPLVEESLNLLRISIPSNIAVQTRFTDGSPHVLADPTQIHQIVVNLGTNAIHAMRPHGGVLSFIEQLIEVEAGPETRSGVGLKPGRYISLQVRDTGCGMDRETMNRVFDPFFTTKGPNEGTGLGLSVVHGIVQRLGGRISVESQIGVGTTFTLVLPVSESAPPPPPRQLARNHQGKGERILVVDDEESVVALTCRVLRKLGYEPTPFQNPIEALDYFTPNAHQFAAVITDLAMPHISGDELAAKLLAVRPGLPVIMTSGFVGAEDQRRVEQLGIRHLVLKPATVEELGSALRDALAGMPAQALDI